MGWQLRHLDEKIRFLQELVVVGSARYEHLVEWVEPTAMDSF